MNRYSVLALVVLVGFVLPFGVSAQKYPKSNYKYKPKQRVYKSTTPSTSTHGNASGTKAIQGHTEDFEKLRNFSKNSNEYKLGSKVAHLYINGWVCTGFLVGPDLLMTNEHCLINIPLFAFNCKVYMDYYSDNRKGAVSAGVKRILKSSKALDYALLRLDRRLGDTHGWLQLDTKTPRKWSPVKIIQHPRGRSKEIVRRNTPITQVYSDMIHYQADTQGGSSGSPVFSLDGNSVIAIHRAGKAGYYNEGVLMKRIVPQINHWLSSPVPVERQAPGMVLIPAGEFQMGSDAPDLGGDQRPVHTVYVDAFYIDKYEVTVGQYKQFVRATGHRALPDWVSDYSPTDRHPVVGVSWHDAMAYAAWAGKRLPTEAEWEKAARGGVSGQKYPWGNAIDPSKANYNDHVGKTTPVGRYVPNGYGLYDMAGNVEEWCLDEYDEGFYGRTSGPNPIAGGTITSIIHNFTNVKTDRVLRGGSWFSSDSSFFGPEDLRVASRYWEAPSVSDGFNGFRCVRSQ